MTDNHHQPAALALLLLILLAILGLLMTSCTHTRYIESVRIETRFDSVFLADSVYISDSVRIETRFDTCFIDRRHTETRWREMESVRVDTIFHTDSIYVERAQTMSGWQRFKNNSWWLFVCISIVSAILFIFAYRKYHSTTC